MIKILFVLGVMFGSFANAKVKCKGVAQCLPYKNIEVHLFGKYMSPNPNDFDAVRLAIGSLVADLQIKKYVFIASGFEGGFAVCLAPNGQQGYENMIQKMSTIEINSNETAYTIKHVEKCSE